MEWSSHHRHRLRHHLQEDIILLNHAMDSNVILTSTMETWQVIRVKTLIQLLYHELHSTYSTLCATCSCILSDLLYMSGLAVLLCLLMTRLCVVYAQTFDDMLYTACGLRW